MASEIRSEFWGHTAPHNRGRWVTLDFGHDLKNAIFYDFWHPQYNSNYQLMASEAAEAGLTWPKTSALISRGYKQSFYLLALKRRLLLISVKKRLSSARDDDFMENRAPKS